MSEIAIRGVSKRFGQTEALKDVSLTLRTGEIHALCGQNGSGKSTLVKVLSAVHQPDSGSVEIWGTPAEGHWQPSDYGIAVIHQNLALEEELTLLENFGATTGFGVKRRKPIISWRKERQIFKSYARLVGLRARPNQLLRRIRPSDRALLAISRALRDLDNTRTDETGGQLLILDEPTTYLPIDEKERLAGTIRTLANSGIAVLLISHEIDYVLATAHKVTVLRDGAVMSSGPTDELDERKIVSKMIGRPLTQFYPTRESRPAGDVLLEVRGIAGHFLRPLSLQLRAGEVLGMTGLAGGGYEEIPYLLHQAYTSGSADVEISQNAKAAAGGVTTPIALVPANREADAVWLGGTAAENVSLPALSTLSPRGVINKGRERGRAKRALADVGVRPLAPNKPLHQFSGGNQQKIVLARWLSTDVRVFVLHEPVQGIDVAANAEIFKLIVAAAARGAGVLICSNEWEHLVNLCDRVIALRNGEVVAELTGEGLTEKRLATACQVPVDVMPQAEERAV